MTSPSQTEQRPTADLPIAYSLVGTAAPCSAHDWCGETGPHAAHLSTPLALPSPKPHPYFGECAADAYIADVDGDGDLSLALDVGGVIDVTPDEMRAWTAKARAWLNQLDALATQFETVTTGTQA